MKRQIVAAILSMYYLLVFAQTSNDMSHLYRIGDIIYSNSIGNIHIGESGDSSTWDFRYIKPYDSSLMTEFTFDYERKGVIAEIYGNTRHYCSQDSASINDVGNISSQLWSTSDYGQTRGYKFYYDQLDRLKEAVYGETASLSDKQNRYNEKVVEYTSNGAMKRFQRRGQKDNGEYGKIDNLNIKLDGNRLLTVTDDALPANKYSSFNFIDGANEQVEYEYNGVGSLVKDLNRGMTVIYDNQNNPRRIDFNDGNSITYNYLPDGTLLSKSYGLPKESDKKTESLVNSADTTTDLIYLSPAKMLYVGKTEYSGNFIYSNSKINKVLFPGGYCTFSSKDKSNEPTFHYYTQDHLGNNRVVTNEDGTVEQITHYYPFGGTFDDAGLNSSLQQYKYNGKEFDRVAGLNTYDYGARQYFSALPMWDRMDPKCEEDYEISPYAYCGNNPISRVDKDGKDWYYTTSGLFLGVDNKKTDNIIIREYNIKSLGNPSWQNKSPIYIDTYLKSRELSAYAYSNIFTDILIRNGYDMLKTGSGKIEVAKTDFVNFEEMTNRASTKANSYAVTTKIGKEKFNITAFINTSYGGTQNIFSTVSNVVNVLGIHEFKGHGIYKMGNNNKDHIRIYKMQKDDSTWKKTTHELKEHVKDILNELR